MIRLTAASLLATASLFALTGQAHAECTAPTGSANNPTGGEIITCSNGLDNAGVNGPAAAGVTVNTEAPSGGISTTGQPGVLLGEGATINVGSSQGSAFPINTSGDNAAGIDVGNLADITVDGQVATSGGTSPAITTGDNASVSINGAAVGRVQTGGGGSPAISVGANSTVETTGSAVVTTGNSNSAAIQLRGDGSTATIGAEGRITTSSGMSNPILVQGAMGTVDVSGRVQSSAGDATAILGTGDGLTVNVMDGGLVTASSSNSNGIEAQGMNAEITVANGGEVRISSGNSSAIVAGKGGTVRVDGTVSASSSQSQGVVLGDGAELTVQSRGVIETSSSESQAVRITEDAMTATVTVERGGNINAVGAQSILDLGMTDTEVTVDGTVFGGSSDPILDMRAGDDTVIVNGTVEATSANPVIDLGAGDDRLENNSSTTIKGPGVLADGGEGNDSLVVANGESNNSSDYRGFETTTAQRNSNPNDPNNGMMTTLNVNDMQEGRQSTTAGEGGQVNVQNGGDAGNVSAMSGGAVNVESGGTAQVTQDGQTGANQGGTVNFADGSTARVNAGNTGAQNETQQFTGTTFGPGGTIDVANRDFVSGAANAATPGQLDLTVDFAGSGVAAANGNAAGAASVLDALLAAGNLTPEQQAALDALAAGERGTGAVALSRLSGEVPVQAAAAGFAAAQDFSRALRPITTGNPAASYGTPFGDLTTDDLARGVVMTANADLAEALPAPVQENAVFGGVYGSHFDVDANSRSTAFDADTIGAVLGYQTRVDDTLFGVALGYGNTDLDAAAGSADIDTFSIGAFTAGRAGALSGFASIAYSYQDIDAGGISLDGHVFSAQAEGVYDLLGAGDYTLGALGRLELNFADYDGFSTAGPLGIGFSGADPTQFVAGLGVRVGTRLDFGSTTALLSLDVLYEGVMGDEVIDFGSAAFTTAAPTADEDRLRVGVGAGFAISDTTSLDLRYDGTFGSDVTSHGGSAKLTIRF